MEYIKQHVLTQYSCKNDSGYGYIWNFDKSN